MQLNPALAANLMDFRTPSDRVQRRDGSGGARAGHGGALRQQRRQRLRLRDRRRRLRRLSRASDCSASSDCTASDSASSDRPPADRAASDRAAGSRAAPAQLMPRGAATADTLWRSWIRSSGWSRAC